MRKLLRSAAFAAATVLLAACASMPGPWRREQSEREWVSTFTEAHRRAAQGRPASADSLLERFARDFPRSNEATETLYWRALFRLDPANASARPSDATELLDAYLAASTPTTHLVEAQALRRTAKALDSLQRALVVTRAVADSAAALAARPAAENPEEVQKLKEELAKTQAELDRIKRRLASPQGRAP